MKCEDELVQASIEFANVSLENLELAKRLRSMDSELLELQSAVGTLRDEILQLKKHPEVEKGPQSERIQKYGFLDLDSESFYMFKSKFYIKNCYE